MNTLELNKTDGFVYVCSNPCYTSSIKLNQPIYKIGETQDIINRLKQLKSSTSVQCGFKLERCIKSNNYKKIEKDIHNILDDDRETNNR